MENLKSIIENLISLNQEGEYWDFKREWYKCNKDLLHDIICMANNLANRDAYIIIGVDEEDKYNIKDVSNNKNRKNTQQIVDFLKDKKFAGDIRPIVYVKSIDFLVIDNVEDELKIIIDVIVIQNSSHTPFYLTEQYKGLLPYHIYTRIQDTNSPINMSADVNKVEWLWKKRFGLIQSPIERIEIFLSQPCDWIDYDNDETKKYYKYLPEYKIEYYDASDVRHGYEYYLFSQCDVTPKWIDIKIYYHQTILKWIGGVLLDGGRYTTPCPETDYIKFSNNYNDFIAYKYMIKGSLIYKLYEFFYVNEKSSESDISRDKYMKVILLFESDEERKNFENYVIKKYWCNREQHKKKIMLPCIEKTKEFNADVLKRNYENALILQLMLNDFRNIKI